MLDDGDVACGEHAPTNSSSTFPPTNESCWADCFESEWTGTTPFGGALIDSSHTSRAAMSSRSNHRGDNVKTVPEEALTVDHILDDVKGGHRRKQHANIVVDVQRSSPPSRDASHESFDNTDSPLSAVFAITAFDYVDTARRGNATFNRTPQRRLRYKQSVFLLDDHFVTCTTGIAEVEGLSRFDHWFV